MQQAPQEAPSSCSVHLLHPCVHCPPCMHQPAGPNPEPSPGPPGRTCAVMASTVATTLSSCIAALSCWLGGLMSPLLLPRPPPPPLPPSRPSSGHGRLVPRPPWAAAAHGAHGAQREARARAAAGQGTAGPQGHHHAFIETEAACSGPFVLMVFGYRTLECVPKCCSRNQGRCKRSRSQDSASAVVLAQQVISLKYIAL